MAGRHREPEKYNLLQVVRMCRPVLVAGAVDSLAALMETMVTRLGPAAALPTRLAAREIVTQLGSLGPLHGPAQCVHDLAGEVDRILVSQGPRWERTITDVTTRCILMTEAATKWYL